MLSWHRQRTTRDRCSANPYTKCSATARHRRVLTKRVTQWLATASEADTNEYTEKLLPPNMCLAKVSAGALADSSLAYEMFVDDSVADAYTKIAPGLPADDFRRLLAHAWMAPRGPDSVVKLIFQLGNVRTDGGGQRKQPFLPARLPLAAAALSLHRAAQPAPRPANTRASSTSSTS